MQKSVLRLCDSSFCRFANCHRARRSDSFGNQQSRMPRLEVGAMFVCDIIREHLHWWKLQKQ